MRLTFCLCLIALLMSASNPAKAQELRNAASNAESMGLDADADLKKRVETLEMEVAELKRLLKEHASSTSSSAGVASTTNESPVNVPSSASPAHDNKTTAFFRDMTVNLGLDAYYGFNFNNPVGRVNLLRAYD